MTDHDATLPAGAPLDLDDIAADFDAVNAALERLEDGTYFTDEVTGQPIDPAVLAARPTARHA